MLQVKNGRWSLQLEAGADSFTDDVASSLTAHLVKAVGLQDYVAAVAGSTEFRLTGPTTRAPAPTASASRAVGAPQTQTGGGGGGDDAGNGTDWVVVDPANPRSVLGQAGLTLRQRALVAWWMARALAPRTEWDWADPLTQSKWDNAADGSAVDVASRSLGRALAARVADPLLRYAARVPASEVPAFAAPAVAAGQLGTARYSLGFGMGMLCNELVAERPLWERRAAEAAEEEQQQREASGAQQAPVVSAPAAVEADKAAQGPPISVMADVEVVSVDKQRDGDAVRLVHRSSREPFSPKKVQLFDAAVVATPAPVAAKLLRGVPEDWLPEHARELLATASYTPSLHIAYTVRMTTLRGKVRAPLILPHSGAEQDLSAVMFPARRFDVSCPPGLDIVIVYASQQCSEELVPKLEAAAKRKRQAAAAEAAAAAAEAKAGVTVEHAEAGAGETKSSVDVGVGAGGAARGADDDGDDVADDPGSNSARLRAAGLLPKRIGPEHAKMDDSERAALHSLELSAARRLWSTAVKLVPALPDEYERVAAIFPWATGFVKHEPGSGRATRALRVVNEARPPVVLAGDYLGGGGAACGLEAALRSGVWAAGALAGSLKRSRRRESKKTR